MPHADEGSRADVLPLQPRPINCMVAVIADDGGRARTAIARTFDAANAHLCRLCPACTARYATTRASASCLVVADRLVADREAPLYLKDGGRAVADDGLRARHDPATG